MKQLHSCEDRADQSQRYCEKSDMQRWNNISGVTLHLDFKYESDKRTFLYLWIALYLEEVDNHSQNAAHTPLHLFQNWFQPQHVECGMSTLYLSFHLGFAPWHWQITIQAGAPSQLKLSMWIRRETARLSGSSLDQTNSTM